MKISDNQEIKNFINDHSDLFWYTPEDKKENISIELLLETILNYGTLKESLRLIDLIGSNKAREILKKAKGRKKWTITRRFIIFFCFILVEKSNNIYGQLFSEKLFRAQLCYFDDIDYDEAVEFLIEHPSDKIIREFLIEKAVDVLWDIINQIIKNKSMLICEICGIENWGRGTINVVNNCVAHGIPEPEFRFVNA